MPAYEVRPHGDHWQFAETRGERASMSRPTRTALFLAIESFMVDKRGKVRVLRADGSVEEIRSYPQSLAG